MPTYGVRVEWYREVTAESREAARALVLDEPLDTLYISDIEVEGDEAEADDD